MWVFAFDTVCIILQVKGLRTESLYSAKEVKLVGYTAEYESLEVFDTSQSHPGSKVAIVNHSVRSRVVETGY